MARPTLPLPLALLVLLALFASSQAQAAARAWFDRDTVTLGETVTLNVEVDGALQQAPDLSPLQRDFRVLGTSSSAQVSIVNGRQVARTLWAVALEPTTEGVIGVPSLTIGSDTTAPLHLTVRPAPTAATHGAGDDAFLEVEASPRDPYVQQHVQYRVRLFYAVQLLEGQLDEPQPDGARIQRIGNDTSYQTTLAGRRYQVVERRYLLIPERSGALEVPAPRFRGRGVGAGLFRGGGHVLQASGDVLTLDVRSVPDGAPRPWLPTPQLQLRADGDPLPASVRVGEPITLALRLQARDLLSEQLPELGLPDVAGAQVYPDREDSQLRETADGVVGERRRRFAIVPTEPGVLQIPPLRIGWWNTVSDRAEFAELPARRIEVLPALGGTQPSAPVETPATTTDVQPTAVPGVWPWLVLAFALLWVATLGWALQLRAALARPAAATTPSAAPSTARPALAAALRSGDPRAIAAALRAAPPDGPTASLQAVAARLADPRQAAAVAALERALYADGAPDTALAALRGAFATGPRWQDARADVGDGDGLPPLYR